MQFDTLDYAKRLQIAGVPALQAEAQAKALGEALGKAVPSQGDLSAMEDRFHLKLDRLEAKIDAVEGRLEAKVDAVSFELKLDLGGRIETLKWMFGVLVALNVGILMRLLFVQ